MKTAAQSGDFVEDKKLVLPTRQWVETFVVGMNLCPFAKREMVKNRVRFATTTSSTAAQLLEALQVELELLSSDPSIETTLLIHANVLQDFHDYNRFLNDAENLLAVMGLEGVYQIASFHPGYQFDGTAPDDAENYTNRSPYPMLHLLREASLERAIANYPEVDQIPVHNIALMNRLGQNRLQALLNACFYDSDP